MVAEGGEAEGTARGFAGTGTEWWLREEKPRDGAGVSEQVVAEGGQARGLTRAGLGTGEQLREREGNTTPGGVYSKEAMNDKRCKKSEANLKQLYQLLQNERAHRTQLERQLEDHLYQKIQKEEDGNVLFSGCGNLLTRDDQADSDTEASNSRRKDPFLNMFSW
ncbi:hypothetical protein CYMTET_18920 [Cymbomonas tetramitiformis]|uniref:Uncharacterized protein n=1 Tax=Cymbomonas tetramitiformis TaxID=36881 RepID=A0AAE0G7Q7_9CHLO|nr:hypothetical protein CYMTET_18920 [Cymbomonas tetramitiformis]